MICNSQSANTPRRVDLSTVRGDSFVRTLLVTVKDEPLMLGDDGVARLCIFDGSCVVIRKIYTSADQAESGEITLTIHPADTQALTAGTYRYEIEITTGSAVLTPVTGAFNLIEDMITPEVRDE